MPSGTTTERSPVEFVLFLGAGASASFGIPTLTGLKRRVKTELPSYLTRLGQIERDLRASGFRTDIEKILMYLDASGRPRNTFRVLGPAMIPLSGRVSKSSLKPREADNRLAIRIKKTMRKSCLVKDGKMRQHITAHYDRMMPQLVQRFGLTSLTPPPSGLSYPDVDVFTTNYDNVLETLCFDRGLGHTDGYADVTGSRQLSFDEKEYDVPNRIRIYKLNGSVELVRLRGDGIVRTDSPLRPTWLGYAVQDLLIYPGLSKKFWKKPQLELFYKLKESLGTARNCLCVGYSFGDEEILDVFIEAIWSNASLKLYIVSPDAAVIKRNRFQNHNQVEAVSKKFEDLNPLTDLP